MDKRANPIHVAGSCLWTAFAADDNPVHHQPPLATLLAFKFWTAIQRKRTFAKCNWAKQWLDAEETESGGNFKEFWDAFVGALLVFHGDAEPDVGGKPVGPAAQALSEVDDILRAFREQQPIEVGRVINNAQEVIQPFNGHFVVKRIAEGGEDAGALLVV